MLRLVDYSNVIAAKTFVAPSLFYLLFLGMKQTQTDTRKIKMMISKVIHTAVSKF